MEIGLPKKADFWAEASSNDDLGIPCHRGKKRSVKITGYKSKGLKLGWRNPLSVKSGAIWALKRMMEATE